MKERRRRNWLLCYTLLNIIFPVLFISEHTDANGVGFRFVEGLRPDVYLVKMESGVLGCGSHATEEAIFVVFDPGAPHATCGGFFYPDSESTLPAVTVKDIYTLGAAYAEAGDFEAAPKWQKLAIELLPENVSGESRADYESRLKPYQEGNPYRDSP